ncbi:hypothetical protein FMM68_02505 [Lachnospiraceae bacterium MD329]|nr:hypothetical protein [Lachnospiraceae bacterium MD329]
MENEIKDEQICKCYKIIAPLNGTLGGYITEPMYDDHPEIASFRKYLSDPTVGDYISIRGTSINVYFFKRVSFFMREELLKMERYQKQFKFLNENKLETMSELTAYHKNKSDEMEELIAQRKQLYSERTDENCEEIKKQVSEINSAIRKIRSELRMCKSIYEDAEHIAEKQKQIQSLTQQAEKEVNRDEHKRRSR